MGVMVRRERGVEIVAMRLLRIHSLLTASACPRSRVCACGYVGAVHVCECVCVCVTRGVCVSAGGIGQGVLRYTGC